MEATILFMPERVFLMVTTLIAFAISGVLYTANCRKYQKMDAETQKEVEEPDVMLYVGGTLCSLVFLYVIVSLLSL